MITHFAELQLNTLSISSVRQFYYEQLHFLIAYESEQQIRFQMTEHAVLSFVEVYEPLAPAHIAFEVPYSKFDQVVAAMKANH